MSPRASEFPQNIIEIPIEFYDDFISNPIVAWQSFGDTPQESESPYFEYRRAIHDMVDQNRPNPIDKDMKFDPGWWCTDDNYRFMHLDGGYTHDAYALSMCHVSEWRKIAMRRKDERGEFYFTSEYLPDFTFDLLFRIKPEKGHPVDFEQIREIIYEIDRRGFPILLMTFDRFQSVHTMQLLARETEQHHGFICANLSLDRTTTYPVIDFDRPERYRKESTIALGKFSGLAAWTHGKTAIQSGRCHVPFYEPQSESSEAVYGNVKKCDVDDFGVVVDEHQYITLIEQEALGATYDARTMHVRESPRGSIDLLESVIGAMFNANNNVTYFEPEEDTRARQQRLAHQMAAADNEFDRQAIEREARRQQQRPEEDEDARERPGPRRGSIFDESNTIDGADYY